MVKMHLQIILNNNILFIRNVNMVSNETARKNKNFIIEELKEAINTYKKDIIRNTITTIFVFLVGVISTLAVTTRAIIALPETVRAIEDRQDITDQLIQSQSTLITQLAQNNSKKDLTDGLIKERLDQVDSRLNAIYNILLRSK